MSSPVLDQALVFNGDASSSGSIAVFPPSVMGQYVEMTVYIRFSSASAAGKVQIQTASAFGYAGTWANVGSTIDWAANTSEKYASVTGVFKALRLKIDTTVTSGTVTAWVIAADTSR